MQQLPQCDEPVSQAVLDAVAHLSSRRARERFVARHPELRSSDAVRVLQRTARELGARNPRHSLALAETAVHAAERLDRSDKLLALRARAQAYRSLSRYPEAIRIYRE